MKRRQLGRLRALGIDLEAITEKLQQDGVAAFCDLFRSTDSCAGKEAKAMVSVELSRKVRS
jgi:hypothetical protein